MAETGFTAQSLPSAAFRARELEPMAIGDISIFSMLRTRLEWAQQRQRVLAENVANSDTPQFRPRDLAPLTFDSKIATAQVQFRA